MAKVSAGDIRNGITIEVDGKVCRTEGCLHNAAVNNILHLHTNESRSLSRLHMHKINYLTYFAFEQIMISVSEASDAMKFVKENEMVKLCSLDIPVFCLLLFDGKRFAPLSFYYYYK